MIPIMGKLAFITSREMRVRTKGYAGCASVQLGSGTGTNGMTLTSLGNSNTCSCVVHAPRAGMSPNVPKSAAKGACGVSTCLGSNA